MKFEEPSSHSKREPELGILNVRGRVLELEGLVNTALLDDERLGGLGDAMQSAAPYAHLVLDGLFAPDFLDLILEEFDAQGNGSFRSVAGPYQTTRRSLSGATLGVASTLYFNILNSGWFTRKLEKIARLDSALIVDADLYGGGLHETRAGGRFDIHTDFDRHPRTGLRNEMVVLTYLNRNWRPEWRGALELWDAKARQKVASIEPEFGRTVILRHGPGHYHGHPSPLAPPPGVHRRSLGTYYYSNPHAADELAARVSSTYLFPKGKNRFSQLMRSTLGPRNWERLRRIAGRPPSGSSDPGAYS